MCHNGPAPSRCDTSAKPREPQRLPPTVPRPCPSRAKDSAPENSGAARPRRSSVLRGTAAAYGRVPHRAVKQRPVQRIQVRQQRGNLRQKRIAQNRGHLFVAAAARVANQLAHLHPKRRGQPLQRSQRGNRLAVLNFRDVGARHQHPPRQLPLAQVARPAHLAHLRGYLQPGLGAIRRRLARHQPRGQIHRLLDIERPAAPSAKGVTGSILHQPAVFTPHHFACFHAHYGSSHPGCAECQSLDSAVLFCTTIGATLNEMNHNCQVEI